MTSKRPRAPSHTSSPSPSSSPSKASRTNYPPLPDDSTSNANVPPKKLICSLPPTCTHRPTPLLNVADMEAHYAKYHAHVCNEPSCGCVFPDARLLELHLTECHDPLAAVRKDRGEKIFACHLPTCPRLFLTPKARRLHLIQAHAFPKEYFFAVTNKGINGLLKRWGEGASMIRKEWKPRTGSAGGEDDDDGDEQDQEHLDIVDRVRGVDLNAGTRAIMEIDGSETQPKIAATTKQQQQQERKPEAAARYFGSRGVLQEDEDDSDEDNGEERDDDNDDDDDGLRMQEGEEEEDPHATPRKPAHRPLESDSSSAMDTSLDTLSNSMHSLTLVPNSIRFGRGGRAGLVNRGGYHTQHQQQHNQQQQQQQQQHPRPQYHPRATSVRGAPTRGLWVDQSGGGGGRGGGAYVPTGSGAVGQPQPLPLGGGAPPFPRGRGRGYRARGRGRGMIGV